MNDQPVVEGEVLAGKYRVERVLGAGGMGVVVAAHHLQLDERVALKFLLPGAAAHAEVVARFAREARAAAKIKSEHVARVSDVGVLESGAPYLVMEYLAGMDLAALLKERGPLPPAEVVEYVLQACEAIAEAHSLGIVHRDLKPGNLFFARRHDGSPCIKVLDFGISKVISSNANDASMTATSAMMGSPLYMSPEQMRSAKAVDQRADIWSLGVILYELLTGAPPFTGATIADLVLEVATRAPRPPSGQRSDLPPGLDAVVLRCLEKEPEQRFLHVGELAVALSDFGPPAVRTSVERISRITAPNASPSVPPVSGPAMPSAAPGSALPNGTAGAWGKTQSGASPKRVRALVAALVAAAAGFTGWLIVGRPEQPGPSASAALAPTTSAPSAVPPAAPATATLTVSPALDPAPSGSVSSAPAASAARTAPPVKASTPPPARRPEQGSKTSARATQAPAAAGAALPPPGALDFGGRN